MKCNTREWLVDTGATSHITPHSYDLARSQTCKVPFSIVGGGSTHASLIGDLVLLASRISHIAGAIIVIANYYYQELSIAGLSLSLHRDVETQRPTEGL